MSESQPSISDDVWGRFTSAPPMSVEERRKEAADRRAEDANRRAQAEFDAKFGNIKPPGDLSKTGEEYLATVDPRLANQARMFIEGRRQIPAGFATRNPQLQQILAIAVQADPLLNEENSKTRVSTRKDFTSGKSAQNITALNTAIGHINSLAIAGEALNNSPVKLWNSIVNYGLDQVSDPRISTFNIKRNAVASELTRVFRGATGNKADIEEWKAAVNSSQGPEQLRKNVLAALDLLNSRLDALKEQYNQGMNTSKEGREFLDPKHQAMYDSLIEGKPLAPGWRQSPLNVPSTTEVQTSPEGMSVSDEDKTAQLQAAFDAGASKAQMEELAKQLYGPSAKLPDIDAGIKYREDFRKSGGEGASGVQIVPLQKPMTEEQKRAVRVLEDPKAAFAANLGSGLSFGIAPLLAGEKSQAQLQYMRERSPKASLTGEMIGSLAPSAVLTKGVGLGSELVAGRLGAEGLSLPAQAATADIVGGGITGATSNPDNPLAGAMVGAAVGGGGGLAGRYVAAPVLTKGMELAGKIPKVSLADVTLAGPKFGSEAEQFLTEAERLGLPAGLGDVNPELTGRVSRVSTEGAQLAGETYPTRQAGIHDRAIQAVRRDVGQDVDIRAAEDQFEQAANMAADPYYDIVRAKPAPVDPALDQMLGTSFGQKGLKRAYQSAEADGRDPHAMGFDLNAQGDVVIVRKPSWDTLIHIRKGINDELNSYRDPITRTLDTSKGEVRDSQRFLNRFTTRLDNLSPDYKQARLVYSEAIRPKDYLHLGAQALDTKVPVADVERTLAEIAKITDDTQREAAMQAYRQGYSTRLVNDISNSKVADPYSVVFGSPAQKSKMGLIGVTPENFAAQHQMEQQLSRTAHETKVGTRGERRAEGEVLLTEGSLPSAILETAVSGAPVVTALNMGRRGLINALSDKRGLGWRATARSKQLAPDLMGTDPTEALQRLQDAQAQSSARLAALDLPRGVVTLLGGTAARSGMAATPKMYNPQYDPRATDYTIGANVPNVVDEDEENFILSDGTKVPKNLAAKPMARGGRASKRLACK